MNQNSTSPFLLKMTNNWIVGNNVSKYDKNCKISQFLCVILKGENPLCAYLKHSLKCQIFVSVFFVLGLFANDCWSYDANIVVFPRLKKCSSIDKEEHQDFICQSNHGILGIFIFVLICESFNISVMLPPTFLRGKEGHRCLQKRLDIFRVWAGIN